MVLTLKEKLLNLKNEEKEIKMKFKLEESNKLNKYQNLSNYNRITKSNSELLDELDGIVDKIAKLEHDKSILENTNEEIIRVIKDRARLKGVEPKISNERIERINIDINNIKRQLKENNMYIFELSNQLIMLNNINFKKEIEEEIDLIDKNIKELNEQYSKIVSDIRLIKSLIIEEQMFPQYDKYADNNGIQYDKNDDFDIFRQCNNHYHNGLLNGYKTKTKCQKQGRKCSEDIILSIINYNNIVGTCECGHGKWIEEDIPENLLYFNITKKNVYGNIDYGGYY